MRTPFTFSAKIIVLLVPSEMKTALPPARSTDATNAGAMRDSRGSMDDDLEAAVRG